MTLALDPHDRIVRGALLGALRRAGRWDELAGELRFEAGLAEGAGASRALRAAAAILARRLERTDDAAAVYRELSHLLARRRGRRARPGQRPARLAGGGRAGPRA